MLRTSVVSKELPGLSLLRESVSRALEVTGRPPRGACTVLVPGRAGELTINGRVLEQGQIAVLTPNTDMHLITQPAADVLSAHIDERMLASETRGSADHPHGPDHAHVAELTALELALLRRQMWQHLSAAYDQRWHAEVASALSTTFNTLLHRDDRESGLIRSSARTRTLARAREYIEHSLHDPIRLEDVCRHANVSERSLQLVFRTELGLTPIRYIKLRRLNAARSALVDPAYAHLNITHIAHLYGLKHLGRFAVDFKSLFGVSPSSLRAQARNPNPR